MKPSSSSNLTGFNCTDPSFRWVAITIRIGSAASFRTAGVSANAFLAPAIDRAGHAQRLDLDLDTAYPRILIVASHVTVREMVDVVATGILRPIDHATLDLCPAPHVLGINQQQRDSWVTLEMFEPAAVGAPGDPERTIRLRV